MLELVYASIHTRKLCIQKNYSSLALNYSICVCSSSSKQHLMLQLGAQRTHLP